MRDQQNLAVILPVFKHPGLVVEAVHSALADPRLVVVAINDGCPFAQTDVVLGEFAAAEPRFKYVSKPNGGLSSARNTGIEFVMQCLPDVEAIYLLDADNRVLPGAVTRAWNNLRDTEADWLYPGIYMFGIRNKFDFDGEYSLLTNLAQNTCEAGSLVRRRVFEAGVRFDESMKKGYEDWDFWLACAAAGFRGKADNNLGLLYRKRAESMLRDSARDHEEIMAYMREKWKKLFHPRSIIALECEEAPRYAYVSSHNGEMREATDPIDFINGAAPASAFLPRVVEHNQARLTNYFPPFLVFGEQALVDELGREGLLRGVFWLAEAQLGDKVGVVVSVAHAPGEIHFTESAPSVRRASLLFINTRVFLDCATDSSLDWAQRELVVTTSTTLGHVGLQMPLADSGLRSAHVHHADQLCMGYLRDLRDAARGRPLERPLGGERTRSIPSASDRYLDARSLTKAGPLFPARKKIDERRAVFAVPVASYGGVEQVAYAMAKEFRRGGYQTRLLVSGSAKFCRSTRNQDAFDEVLIVADEDLLAGGVTGANESYYGQPFMPSMTRDLPRLQGALWDADVFVNCHASSLNGLAGELRRNGCVTVSSIHVIDKTSLGRLAGHPYFSLAYEHGYDLMVPCSESMGAWLRGMGVPAEKVVPLLNATDLEAPPRPLHEGPLRVLVLGRFDYQKGLDRFQAVIDQANALGLEIEWKVIGSSLLDHLKDTVGLASVPNLSISPPVYSADELASLLTGSDVLLLLSRWEGLPLTLLEAMRCGAIPVATDVGAVGELVQDANNGYLVDERQPPGRLASDIAERLGWLAADVGLRERLSAAATDSVESRGWASASAPLIARCDELLSMRIRT